MVSAFSFVWPLLPATLYLPKEAASERFRRRESIRFSPSKELPAFEKYSDGEFYDIGSYGARTVPRERFPNVILSECADSCLQICAGRSKGRGDGQINCVSRSREC